MDSPIFRMLVLIVAVLIVGSLLHPGAFVTERNFQSIFKQLGEFGILAIAVFICMLSGGIDLSVVYIANLCGILISFVLVRLLGTSSPAPLEEAWPAILLVVVMSLAVGAVCGLFNGILISRFGVPAMLATLGSGQLFLGISTVLTGGKATSGIPTAFAGMARFTLLTLPLPFVVFLVCGLIMGLLISATSFGLRVQMIGTNERAARFSGLNNARDITMVYTISGMFAAVSGIISVMRMSSAKPDYGTSYVMYSILICVFGGTNPNGGKGSVLGIVLATLILQMVSTMMNMFSSLSSFYRDIVWGAMLIIMLIVNYVLDSRKVVSR